MKVNDCFLVICLFLTSAFGLVAQDRKPLEHEDYDLWNSISGTTLSENGDWVMYTIRDGKDNSTLKIRGLNSSKQYTIKNAAGPRISYDK